MEKLSVKNQITVLKPVKDVFEAVLNPAPFFVQKTSGLLREGDKIIWEFTGIENGEFPVMVQSVVLNRTIKFEWGSDVEGQDNLVEFTFEDRDGKSTTVTVVESGWPNDEKGRESSYRNSSGWMNMLCCLKAYLEHNINLRKGSFLHMGMNY